MINFSTTVHSRLWPHITQKVKKIKSLLFLSLTLSSRFLLQLFLFSFFLCSVCLTVSSYLHLFSFILLFFFLFSLLLHLSFSLSFFLLHRSFFFVVVVFVSLVGGLVGWLILGVGFFGYGGWSDFGLGFVSLIGLCGGFWQWVVHGGSRWLVGRVVKW